MISDLQQLWTRTRLLSAACFCCWAGGFLFRNKPAGPYFLTPGVLLLVFGLVAPRSLKIAYIVWMSLAFTMGLLRNHILLAETRQTV